MSFKKCRGALHSAINSLDKFEVPVQLNLKGGIASTSTLGGIISLIIVLFLSFQFIIQSIGMFNRDSRQVVQMSEFQNDPDSIYLSRENNFFLVMSTRIGATFVNMSDHSLISYKAFYYKQRFTPFGPENIGVGQILWAPCQRSDVPKIFPESTYDNLFLAVASCASAINFTHPLTGVCPDDIMKDHPDCITPPNFKIHGTMFSSTFEFIDVKVTLCDPSDAATIAGLKCSPTAENETLAAEGVFVYLGYTNTYIDPSNYTTPNHTFVDFVDWNLHPQQTRTANIYVDVETIKDYDSYLFTGQYNQHTFYSISPDQMREQQLTPRDYLLEVAIMRSKMNHVTTRSYVRINDVLSKLVGSRGLSF